MVPGVILLKAGEDYKGMVGMLHWNHNINVLTITKCPHWRKCYAEDFISIQIEDLNNKSSNKQ